MVAYDMASLDLERGISDILSRAWVSAIGTYEAVVFMISEV